MKTSIKLATLAFGLLLLAAQSSLAQPGFILDPAFHPTVTAPGGVISSGFPQPDGKLIVLGEGGKLGLFRPNSTRAEEISTWQVPQLRYPCWAGPVLARKKLYLRSEDRLMCFGLALRDKD